MDVSSFDANPEAVVAAFKVSKDDLRALCSLITAFATFGVGFVVCVFVGVGCFDSLRVSSSRSDMSHARRKGAGFGFRVIRLV